MRKIEPVVKKVPLHEDDDRISLLYWLGRSPDERMDAMRSLREQYYAVMNYDNPPRIEKTVLKRPR